MDFILLPSYLLGIPHLHENRPILASLSVLLGVRICCCNTSNHCSYSWQYVMLTKSVESFSKSFFQNALELYLKMWQLGKLQSVMDSYCDKSCDICAQTVTLPAYELFRARSTRIRRFLNPQYFLCVFGLRPHVSSVSGIQIHISFNALFRVKIFEYAMSIQNHMDAKSGYFFLSSDVTLSNPVLRYEYSRRCRAQCFRFFTSLTLGSSLTTCLRLNLWLLYTSIVSTWGSTWNEIGFFQNERVGMLGGSLYKK